MWKYSEEGDGRPLVLLHGIGMSRTVWNPVMPLLKKERRVIAFDIAGFGDTPPLPKGVVPTVANLVNALAENLQEMGIKTSVDIAGNSMGGYMALEAATRGIARSVVAISPAGLWQMHPSAYVKYIFMTLRGGAKMFPTFAKVLFKMPIMREILLAVPISLKCSRMPECDAIRAMEDFAKSPVFWEVFNNVRPFIGGQSVSVPVTVAFGTRDWLLLPSSQQRDELPAHAKWIHPGGWGHVPMWLDPIGVSRLILEHTK